MQISRDMIYLSGELVIGEQWAAEEEWEVVDIEQEIQDAPVMLLVGSLVGRHGVVEAVLRGKADVSQAAHGYDEDHNVLLLVFWKDETLCTGK